jgi:hypothetical protein
MPSSAGSSIEIARNRTVFPEPDGPTIASDSPGRSSKHTPRKSQSSRPGILRPSAHAVNNHVVVFMVRNTHAISDSFHVCTDKSSCQVPLAPSFASIFSLKNSMSRMHFRHGFCFPLTDRDQGLGLTLVLAGSRSRKNDGSATDRCSIHGFCLLPERRWGAVLFAQRGRKARKGELGAISALSRPGHGRIPHHGTAPWRRSSAR